MSYIRGRIGGRRDWTLPCFSNKGIGNEKGAGHGTEHSVANETDSFVGWSEIWGTLFAL